MIQTNIANDSSKPCLMYIPASHQEQWQQAVGTKWRNSGC